MAHIETLIEATCCDRALNPLHTKPPSEDSFAAMEKSVVTRYDIDVAAESGGREICTLICHQCGSEYMFGIITRTREQSLASDKFDKVDDAVLEAAGVDTEDFNEPDDPDVAMCARCDGPVLKATDFCPGCQEFVCDGCRTRIPRVGRFRTERHQADEHWQEPKFAEVVTLSSEDDGSVLTGDDAIFTPEVEG